MDPISEIEFIDKTSLKVGELRFELFLGPGIRKRQSEEFDFILMKTDYLVRSYQQMLAPVKPRCIVELGIQRGGSVAFFNELFKPQLHIAFELDKPRIAALDTMATRVEPQNRNMELHYGVDQADSGQIGRLVDAALAKHGLEAVDVVIDDASHLYPQSKASFECLFPRLRAGGQYVLEDWGWAHWAGYQAPDAPWAKLPALSNLVFEFLMLAASRQDVVPRVLTTAVTSLVQRGPAALDRATFTLNELIRRRGREFHPI